MLSQVGPIRNSFLKILHLDCSDECCCLFQEFPSPSSDSDLATNDTRLVFILLPKENPFEETLMIDMDFKNIC